MHRRFGNDSTGAGRYRQSKRLVENVVVELRVQLLALRSVWPEALAVNVTSAVAWLAYFGALKRVEPSVVNTIFSGISPLAVTLLALVGLRSAINEKSRPAEHAAHVGLVATLAFTVWVVLSGHAAPIHLPIHEIQLGLALAAISGIVISAETVIAKRMNDAGIAADTVVAVRFVLISIIAAIYVVCTNGSSARHDVTSLLLMVFAALLLIVVPIYLVQAAIAHTSPMTTNVILALQPVLVFVAQSSVWNQPPSIYVLGAVTSYAFFAILGVALPLWPRSAAAMAN